MKLVTRRHVYFSHGLRNACLAGALLATQLAFAQNAAPAVAAASDALMPEGLTARYPSGSIQSNDMANRALVEVEQQRAALEQRYAAQQNVCYSKFFATSCLDVAKESRRLALAQIRKVEVEANSFIRSARVVERDHNLAEKRANEANNRPKPSTETVAHPKDEHAAEGEQPVAQHDATPHPKQQADDPKKRAENVAAFEKKSKDAAARQRDVAAKKAEKERQAAAKAASASAAASVKP